MNPQSWKVSNMLLGKTGGQVLIAPERMRSLGQSRNDAQLWMHLVVKVNSNVIKNNIAQSEIGENTYAKTRLDTELLSGYKALDFAIVA